MSVIDATVTNIEDLWKADKNGRKSLSVLERRLLSIEAQLRQIAQAAGDAAYGPFSYPPPYLYLMLVEELAQGKFRANRLVGDNSGILLDAEDDRDYQVFLTPGNGNGFVGARCFCMHSHNQASLIEEDNGAQTAIYWAIGGECQPFTATTVGTPAVVDDETFYGWSQSGLIAAAQYTHASEPVSGNVLGKAHLVTQFGWDESVALDRIALAEDTPVLVWYDASLARFEMLQVSEVQVEACPS